jgi:hypothetical protein
MAPTPPSPLVVRGWGQRNRPPGAVLGVANPRAPSKDVRGTFPRYRDRAPAPFARKVGRFIRSRCRRGRGRRRYWRCRHRRVEDPPHDDPHLGPPTLGDRAEPLGSLPRYTRPHYLGACHLDRLPSGRPGSLIVSRVSPGGPFRRTPPVQFAFGRRFYARTYSENYLILSRKPPGPDRSLRSCCCVAFLRPSPSSATAWVRARVQRWGLTHVRICPAVCPLPTRSLTENRAPWLRYHRATNAMYAALTVSAWSVSSDGKHEPAPRRDGVCEMPNTRCSTWTGPESASRSRLGGGRPR